MSIGNIFVSLIFGGIGFVAFAYGKKIENYKMLGIGIALMAYPYFVPNTVAACVIGVLLTALLFIFRD